MKMRFMKECKEAWQPWIEIVRDDDESEISFQLLHKVLRNTPVKFRRVVAAALAVAKWHPNNQNRGAGACGWCEYTTEFEKTNSRKCGVCPLAKIDRPCFQTTSLFQRALPKRISKSANRKTSTTNKLYLILYKIYADEYRKAFGG